jgi:hypothetical protein
MQFSLYDIAQLSTIIGGVVVFIGLIAIWIQLKKGKQINEARFVIDIFEQYKSHNPVFFKINPFEE